MSGTNHWIGLSALGSYASGNLRRCPRLVWIRGFAPATDIPPSLPPLAEQRRIVGKVEQLMAWVDELEQLLTAARATAANLLAALVAELTAV